MPHDVGRDIPGIAAESTGEWPELDGRFIRPGSVASIDVLSSE